MANKPKGNQYVPFDALKGFSDKLREVEQEVVKKRELTSDKIEELNEKIQSIRKGDYLKITFYNKNKYDEITGTLKQIDFVNGYSYFYLKINFDDFRYKNEFNKK